MDKEIFDMISEDKREEEISSVKHYVEKSMHALQRLSQS